MATDFGAETQTEEDVAAERARMGRDSGILWMGASAVAVVCTFLPGSQHVAIGWTLALGAAAFAYGLASISGAIPWQRASMTQLSLGVALTIPVIGLALYMTGASLSFVEPLLVCTLLYAGFYFPSRWAWPLTVELILVAGTPLIYDADAIENAYLPRYVALALGYLAATGVMIALKTRLVAAEERQREIAYRDPLTGVGNRRAFDERLLAELDDRREPHGRRQLDDTPLALCIIDLDDFKGVNDGLGHTVGDAVLEEAATRTQAVLRSTDAIARIGGDEFAVIAPGANENAARALAETIRIALAADSGEADFPPPVASVGWAVFPADGENYGSLMHAADLRMLRRKRNAPRETGERLSVSTDRA